jgi:hypothetical protein
MLTLLCMILHCMIAALESGIRHPPAHRADRDSLILATCAAMAAAWNRVEENESDISTVSSVSSLTSQQGAAGSVGSLTTAMSYMGSVSSVEVAGPVGLEELQAPVSCLPVS